MRDCRRLELHKRGCRPRAQKTTESDAHEFDNKQQQSIEKKTHDEDREETTNEHRKKAGERQVAAASTSREMGCRGSSSIARINTSDWASFDRMAAANRRAFVAHRQCKSCDSTRRRVARLIGVCTSIDRSTIFPVIVLTKLVAI